MFFKKLMIIVSLLSMSFNAFANNFVQPKAFIVYNYSKGEILESHNIYEPLPIASITKLMTAVTFFNEMGNDKNKINDCISIINYEDNDFIKGTQSRLPKNKNITCNALLMAMLIASDNTAAHALSHSTSLTKYQFIKKMNDNAKLFNMNFANFSDSSGLSPQNKASIVDLVNLAHQALQIKEIRDITSAYGAVVSGSYYENVKDEFGNNFQKSTPYSINYRNTNALVREQSILTLDNGNQFSPILLSKTGHIREAGYNLLMVKQNQPISCNNNNDILIVISLGNPSVKNRIDFTQSKLDYYCKNLI